MKDNVESTVEVIRNIAETLESYSKQAEAVARRMEIYEDLSYASEAIGIITNLISNCRLDLLIVRPMRELRRQVEKED